MRMYYYDLHCHTSLSKDSPADIQRTVKIAKRRGIDGIAITDHNTTYKGPAEIEGIQIIPANEITVKKGGHLLAYFIKNDIPSQMDIKEVILEIKKQGGYSVLAHPFRKDHGWMGDRKEDKVEEIIEFLDGIESGNASDLDEERAFASEIAKRMEVIETAGSDLHMSGQVGFSAVAVGKRLNSKNFKKVMKNARIIIRPEAEIFRKEIRRWKKIITGIARFLGIYNIQFTRNIFFKLIIKNYFRIKNKRFERFNFNIKKS